VREQRRAAHAAVPPGDTAGDETDGAGNAVMTRG
jgi:hypothetical protein